MVEGIAKNHREPQILFTSLLNDTQCIGTQSVRGEVKGGEAQEAGPDWLQTNESWFYPLGNKITEEF